MIFVVLLLCASFLVSLLRFAKGPARVDRLVSIDLLTSVLIGLCIWFAIFYGNEQLLSLALVLGILSFASVAFAVFVIEKERK